MLKRFCSVIFRFKRPVESYKKDVILGERYLCAAGVALKNLKPKQGLADQPTGKEPVKPPSGKGQQKKKRPQTKRGKGGRRRR